MKIHGSDLTGRLKDLLERLRSSEEPRPDGSARTGAAGEASSPAGDQVELSPRVRELQLMAEALERTPDLRRALVESLREQIRTGRYAPDGRLVADGLLEEAGEDDLF